MALLANSCSDEILISQRDVSLTNIENIYSVEELQDMYRQRAGFLEKYKHDPKFIFSVGYHTDSLFSISVRVPGYEDFRGQATKIDFSESVWKIAKKNIRNILKKDPNGTITEEFGDLPFLIAKISSYDVIKELIESKDVRLVEYMNLSIASSLHQKSSSHTIQKGPSDPGNPVDPSGAIQKDRLALATCDCNINFPIQPFDLIQINTPFFGTVPWNYGQNFIFPNAWSRTEGNNVGVAIVDTGISQFQNALNANFQTSISGNRSLTQYDFLYHDIDMSSGEYTPAKVPRVQIAEDKCGHGTRMAGIVGAPKGNLGNTVGVAPQSPVYLQSCF